MKSSPYNLMYSVQTGKLELFNKYERIDAGGFKCIDGTVKYISNGKPPIDVLGNVIIFWLAVALKEDDVLIWRHNGSNHKAVVSKGLIDLVRQI